MVARTRQVVWTESAYQALDEVIAYIAQDSVDRATQVLVDALDAGASLATFAERGRIVREIGEPTLRELLVYDYRLLYRIGETEVVIRAFLHGARDFSQWRRDEAPKL